MRELYKLDFQSNLGQFLCHLLGPGELLLLQLLGSLERQGYILLTRVESWQCSRSWKEPEI